MRLVVRTQHEMISIALHIFDGAGAIPANRVNIYFIAAVRLQQVVVAIDQYSSAGQQARIDASSFLSVHFNQHKALQVRSPSSSRTHPTQERLLELQNVAHIV